MALTTEQALEHAQEMEPLDLAARVAHIRMHLDRCDPEDRAVWQEVLDITRNGTPEPKDA